MVYNKKKKKFIPYKEFEDEISKEVESEISLSEWQEALNVNQPNDSGNTITELSEMLNLSRSSLRKRLKRGVKEGCIKSGCAMRNNRVHEVYQIIKKGK
jgi:DNA-binding MarR family transcriptional regulator